MDVREVVRWAGRQIRQRKIRQQPRGRGTGTDGVEGASKKETLTVDGDRTKTDTGGQEEDSQARERTLVKELGKLSP